MAIAEGASAPSKAPPARRASPAVRGLIRGLVVALATALVFVVTLVLRRPAPPSLQIPLPAYELVNERGERFGSADLKGKVYVADFVFTTCPTVCPKLTARMHEVQEQTRDLGDGLRLVTFTVDPENDTPEKLAAYAAKNHADPARWTFLTGSLASIEETVLRGFKVAMGKEKSEPGATLLSIFHGEKFVLVDAAGTIRGYYDADDEGIAKLLRDAGALVKSR